MRRHLATVLMRRCVAALLGRTDLDAGDLRDGSVQSRSRSMASASMHMFCTRLNLADFLREHLELTGTMSVASTACCGACNGAGQRRHHSFLPDAGGAGARRIGPDHRGIVR